MRALLPLLLALSACSPGEQRGECADGEDNDGDDLIDCDDSDCAARVDCREAFVGVPDVIEQYRVEPQDLELEPDILGGMSVGGKTNGWGGDLDGDGLADLGTSVERLLQIASPDGPGKGFREVRVRLSRQRAPGVAQELERDGPNTFRSSLLADSAWAPSVTTKCDVDGDGWHDLSILFGHFNALASWPTDIHTRVRVVYGSPELTAGHTPRQTELLLPELDGDNLGLWCVGDMNGDGGDELLLRHDDYSVDLLLLDGKAMAAGAMEDEAVLRRWPTPLSQVEVPYVGDIDHDGYSDFFFRNGSSQSFSCRYEDENGWLLGWLMPGGSHLVADALPAERSPYDEERPVAEVRVEPFEWEEEWVESPNCLGALPIELTGDGIVDMDAGLAGWRRNVYEGSLALWRGNPIVLRNDSIVHGYGDHAGFNYGERKDSVGITPLASADIDGDGHIDLFARSYRNEYPPRPPDDYLYIQPDLLNNEPDWLVEDSWTQTVAVMFGDGSPTAFDRPFWEADALILISTTTATPFWTQILEDRDGDGGKEIVIGYNTPGDYTVDVFPSSALVRYKLR